MEENRRSRRLRSRLSKEKLHNRRGKMDGRKFRGQDEESRLSKKTLDGA